jgi:hypothetical protein
MALTFFQIRRDVIADLRRRRSRIHDDLERHVSALRANPHMFFRKPTVEHFVTYLDGYDAALHGVPLEGLFYWLELNRKTDGNPQHWISGLPLAARRQSRGSTSQSRLLDAACALLQRFFRYRRRHGTVKAAEKYMRRRRHQLTQRGREAACSW